MQHLGSLDIKSKYLDYRDPVTELFNEEFFLTRLKHAFERAKRRPNSPLAIIAIDVQLGTQPEKQVKKDSTTVILQEIAGRLKKFIRPSDAVARLSDWEFVTLHEYLNDRGEIQSIVKRLREELSRPYEIDDISYDVKFELMPLVRSPQHQRPVDMVRAAQKAMNEARTKG
jgi:diguanylate cyclase (GGDEF)-like protein